tara:strand:+ start:43606 stop:44568 length:963 start_codon:yes stop_codon:yes gene_type:complete
MTRLTLNIFSLILGTLCIFLIFFFNEFSNLIIDVLESNFSKDKNIEFINKFGIKLYLALLINLLLIISMLCFYDFRNFLHKITVDVVDLSKLNIFLFKDKLTSNDHSFLIFVLSSTICFLLTSYFLIIGSPTPEGLLETLVTFFFLISALFFLFSFFLVCREKKIIYYRKNILFFLFFLSSIMIFIFLEEFSWGQKYFNFEAPEVFLKYNFQGEITIHNFFNPLFPIIYPLFGFMILISCLTSWFFSPKLRTNFREIFEPHPSLFLLILAMSSFSLKSDTELFEEFFSIFSLFYSMRIFLCVSNSKKIALFVQFHKNIYR